MSKLLKNDLYRATRDKSLYVALIVFIIYALINILLRNSVSSMNEVASAGLDLSAYGKSTFKSIYNITGDFGMLLPIFITTFIVKDFRFNTIRNKVAAGHSKIQIYLSALISAFIISTILLLTTSLISLGISAGLSGYGPSRGFGSEFTYLLVYVVLQLILIFITVTIIFMITFLTGSTGLGIASAIILASVFSILALICVVLDTNISEAFKTIMSFTNYHQSIMLNSTNVLGDLTTSVDGEVGNLLARILICSPIALIGLNALGMFLFTKKDLK